MIKRIFASLLAAITLFVCFCVPVFADSSNTSIASAQATELNATVSGELTKTVQGQYYSFELTEAGRVNFTVNSTMTLYLRVFDADGNQIFSEDIWTISAAGVGVLDVYVDFARGRYYYGIVPYGSNSFGTFEVKTAYSPADESFPEVYGGSDNTLADANVIEPGTRYCGLLAVQDKTDIFKFELESSGRVTFDLKSYMNFKPYLYDGAGNQLYAETVYKNDVTGVGILTNIMDLTKGTYYLCIGYDYYSATGRYEFTLTFDTANESFQDAQNGTDNTISEANAVELNTKYIGQLAVNDGTDHFRFETKSAGKVKIVFASYFSLVAYLYDESGKQVWNKTCYVDKVTGRCDDIFEVELERGVYYFCAGYDYYKNTGVYEFTIADLIPGDVNGDGKLNAKDVTALMKYLIGSAPKGFIEAAADYDGNGKLNAKDVTALMKFLVSQS